ncbi:hypothetical protein HK097_003858, partial [Rhizophlyctis rosea]
MSADGTRRKSTNPDLHIDTNALHSSVDIHLTQSPAVIDTSPPHQPGLDPAQTTFHRGQLTFAVPQPAPQPDHTQNYATPPDGTAGFVSDSSSSGYSVNSRYPSLAKCVKKLRKFWRKHYSYYRVHLIWFIFVDLIGSIIIYFSTPDQTTYIDALYWASTATFVTGLAPANIQELSRPAQVTMFFLAMLGSPILMSVVPVALRARAFKRVLVTEFGVTSTGKLRRKHHTVIGPAASDNGSTVGGVGTVPGSATGTMSYGYGLQRSLTQELEDEGTWEEFPGDSPGGLSG